RRTARRAGVSSNARRSTRSPSRNVTFRFRIWWTSSSTISRSTQSSSRSRCSTRVTAMPRAANIEAYSTPITPPPTTVMARGKRRRLKISSLVIPVAAEGRSRGLGGAGPHGDAHVLRRHHPDARVAGHPDRVGVLERPAAAQDGHVVPGELVLDHLGLPPDHVGDP